MYRDTGVSLAQHHSLQVATVLLLEEVTALVLISLHRIKHCLIYELDAAAQLRLLDLNDLQIITEPDWTTWK